MVTRFIASPYPDGYVILKPGHEGGVRIGEALYGALRDAPSAAPVPDWLTKATRRGFNEDVEGRTVGDVIRVRPVSPHGYARASYELNLGCNFDCDHCYLGEKRFEGLEWPDRQRLLDIMAEAGVVWLQLTGGEPLIDSLFAETHAYAFDLGMMIQISSNGSTLHQDKVLGLLTERPPYRLTLSIYGGTAESFDAMTRRRPVPRTVPGRGCRR